MMASGNARNLAQRAATLAAAAVAGLLCQWAGWPLPWILGPLLATAVAAIAGWSVYAPQLGRRFGQLVVGASIGLGITVDVAGKILSWLPMMAVSALFAVAVAAALSRPFSRMARIDAKTSYFALMPGGLAEMANIGLSVGASPEAIALSQTIRLTMIVCILPPLCALLGFHGDFMPASAAGMLPLPQIALVLACAGAGVAVTRFVRLNNPWLIGSLLAVALLAASGLAVGHLPFPLYAIGQYLIGISIGSRFRRRTVLEMIRVCWSTAIFVVVLSSILFAAALVLSHFTSLDPGSAVLATSPGGIAEMTLTAQNLSLDVALVAAFHFVRAVVVNGFAAHFWMIARKPARDDTPDR